MFHPYARLAAGQSVTEGPSPTIQHDTQRHEVTAANAALRHKEELAYRASIADAQQRCREARDLLADATERRVCSQDTLAAASDGYPLLAASRATTCFCSSVLLYYVP